MPVWLSAAEVQALPVTGPAWDAVRTAAAGAWGNPILRESKYTHNVRLLAGAYVAVRQGDQAMRARVESELRKLIGTELGATIGGQVPVLACSRKLACYVIAADLLGFREPSWVTWLSGLRTRPLSDSSGFGSHIAGCHEKRPNNFGTYAGMARVAADLYLADTADLAHAVGVYRGWLGELGADVGHRLFTKAFTWNSTPWHPTADPAQKRGINARGARSSGANVDGVLPEDQRRSGGGTPTSPLCQNYVRGALGGVACTAEMLRRNGHPDAPAWGDEALRRAVAWFVQVCRCSFSEDDAWQPYLLRRLLPGLPVPGGSSAPGKGMAWTSWTHA